MYDSTSEPPTCERNPLTSKYKFLTTEVGIQFEALVCTIHPVYCRMPEDVLFWIVELTNDVNQGNVTSKLPQLCNNVTDV